MLVPIKGIKSYQSKGVWYHYHRATGARIKAEYGYAAFVLEVARLDAKASEQPAGRTVDAAIDAYKASRFFHRLAEATQFSYERAFAEMRASGTALIADLTTADIIEAQEAVYAERGRWMANYYVTIFSVVLKHARRKGWVKDNVAKDIEKIERGQDERKANRPWTPAECRAVLDAAPPYLAVPIGLAMLAGFRKADVLALPWSAIRDGLIDHRTAKRSVDVMFPIHPTLANILARAPAHKLKTIAATSRGDEWTESGFNSSFGKLIDRLEADDKVAKGLTMHGLRHTVGTRLVEAGADLDMVKRLLGQQSTAMAQHYTKTADVSEKAMALVGKMKVVG